MQTNDQSAPSRNATVASSGAKAYADVSSEPTMVAFPDWLVLRPERFITYGWAISTDDDGTELFVVLVCWHKAPHYIADITNALRKANGNMVYEPFDTRRVHVHRISLHTETEFEAFGERALAELRLTADEPEIATYLRGESGVEHAGTFVRRPVPRRTRRPRKAPRAELTYDVTRTPGQLREAIAAAAQRAGDGTAEENVDVEIAPDVVLTLASLRAAEQWATERRVVRFVVDDRMLIAYQNGRKMAWDVGGEPATELYLRHCPLDR